MKGAGGGADACTAGCTGGCPGAGMNGAGAAAGAGAGALWATAGAGVCGGAESWRRRQHWRRRRLRQRGRRLNSRGLSRECLRGSGLDCGRLNGWRCNRRCLASGVRRDAHKGGEQCRSAEPTPAHNPRPHHCEAHYGINLLKARGAAGGNRQMMHGIPSTRFPSRIRAVAGFHFGGSGLPLSPRTACLHVVMSGLVQQTEGKSPARSP